MHVGNRQTIKLKANQKFTNSAERKISGKICCSDIRHEKTKIHPEMEKRTENHSIKMLKKMNQTKDYLTLNEIYIFASATFNLFMIFRIEFKNFSRKSFERRNE